MWIFHIVIHFYFSPSNWCSIISLWFCLSLVNNDVEYLFNVLTNLSSMFLIWDSVFSNFYSFLFLFWIFDNALYGLDRRHIFRYVTCRYFLPIFASYFYFLHILFRESNFIILIRFSLPIWSFMEHVFPLSMILITGY